MGALNVHHAGFAKQQPLPWLLKARMSLAFAAPHARADAAAQMIEEIYDRRYAEDAAELEARAIHAAPDPDAALSAPPHRAFAASVLAWAATRYGVRQLVERGVWELAANAEAARAAGVHSSPVLFCAFVDGGFDADELQFFLYCRATLLSQLGARSAYLPAATLTRRQAEAALRAVFGPRAQRSVLHAALHQLCADFFARRASMEAFTFLKARAWMCDARRCASERLMFAASSQLLLAAYHDSRPPCADDDAAPADAAPAAPADAAEHAAWETPPAARNSYAMDASPPRAAASPRAPTADAVMALRALVAAALPDNVEAYADVLVAAVRDSGGAAVDAAMPGDAAPRAAVVRAVQTAAAGVLEAALEAAAQPLCLAPGSAVATHANADIAALAAAAEALLQSGARAGRALTLDDADVLCQRALTSAAVRELEPSLLHALTAGGERE